MKNDLVLIINHLNKVIYADSNGLKLWNVASTDLIPNVCLTASPQYLSHKGTICTKLVLSETNIINVIIEELNFLSDIIGSPDVLYLLRPNKQKLSMIKHSLPGNTFFASKNTLSAENSKSLRLCKPYKLVRNAISDNKKTTDNKFESTFNKNLADKLPLKILLVEDNLINQKVVTLLLKKMGYFPDTSMNGAEALKMLEKKRYDILFMDIQMPVMDGLEATRTIISTWSKNMRPHIIAMTANVMHGDREKCMDAGMDDYLSKPLRINEIEDVLTKWGSV
jgi:CheY-like chemotaxis protein